MGITRHKQQAGRSRRGDAPNMTRFQYLYVPIAASAALLSACTPQPSPDTYSRTETMRPQTVEAGTLQNIRPVNIRPGETRLGMGTGAVLGGIAGSQLGGGTAANVAGGVAGAVAGGALGSALQGSQSTAGLELTVQLDSGRTIAIVQPGGPNDFRVGDRVRVIGNGENTRVSR
jgi:outer membrane lipoprotein SlyB